MKTPEEMMLLNKLNEDMRSIARNWHLRRNENGEGRENGVQHVLVQEYGNYYNHIIWTNARHIGYNVSSPLLATQETFDNEGPKFLYDRLNDGGQWSPSIPMVCADQTSLGPDRAKCNRNYLFSDGMHTCPETLASRYAASLACLLGCVYNNNHNKQQRAIITKESENDTSVENHDEEGMRECERECNEQFMSVMPVNKSWIETNTTLAAFATL